MTSAPIGEMTNLFGIMNAGASSKANNDQMPTATDTFQDIMSTVSTKNSDDVNAGVNQSTATEPSKVKESSTDSTNSKDDAQDVNDRSSDYAKDTDENVSETTSVSEKDGEKVTKTIKELTKDIKEAVAKELNISVDELEKILENLGLTATDLLDTQNVSQLVATVMGDGDMMSLITEEGLSDVVININNDIKDLVQVASQELSMDTTEFTELVAGMEPVTEVEGQEILDSLTENFTEPIDTTVIAKTNVIDVKDSPVFDEKTVETKDINTETKEDSMIVEQSEVSEITTVKPEDELSRNGNEDSNESSQKRSEDKSGVSYSTQQGFAVNADNADVTFDSNILPADEEISQVNTQDIIDQITENMKLMRGNEVTELEMQLNPESLGNIHLTVASKEGNVTAQLEAQNESVRAALELQIQQLKENLEAQGVKVTAVEVTVASHSFEENLQQGDDSNDAMNKEQERLRKATRKLNINELLADDNIEDLDDDEIITAKMMAADGNTMDYKA